MSYIHSIRLLLMTTVTRNQNISTHILRMLIWSSFYKHFLSTNARSKQSKDLRNLYKKIIRKTNSAMNHNFPTFQQIPLRTQSVANSSHDRPPPTHPSPPELRCQRGTSSAAQLFRITSYAIMSPRGDAPLFKSRQVPPWLIWIRHRRGLTDCYQL